MNDTTKIIGLSNFEINQVLFLAEEYKTPSVVYETQSLNKTLDSVINVDSLKDFSELVVYIDPVIGHPSISGDIIVHGRPVRKLINHDVRLRGKAYLVGVSNISNTSVLGANIYPIAVIDSTPWLDSHYSAMGKVNI